MKPTSLLVRLSPARLGRLWDSLQHTLRDGLTWHRPTPIPIPVQRLDGAQTRQRRARHG